MALAFCGPGAAHVQRESERRPFVERRPDMFTTRKNKVTATGLASVLALSLLAGCASTAPREPR